MAGQCLQKHGPLCSEAHAKVAQLGHVGEDKHICCFDIAVEHLAEAWQALQRV